MVNKGRVLFRAGITAIILPFILLFVFGLSFFLQFFIIGIFLIVLSLRYRVKSKEIPVKEQIKKPKLEAPKEHYRTSSNSNIIIGLIIIFLALSLFFLFPLDILIGSQTTLGSLEKLGIQTSFTFYSLFSVCSNQAVSIFISQCGLVMFISIGIFIVIIVGLILLIKGLIKK